MATRYSRSFNSGHHSDLLYNDEMHEIIESVRHITEKPGADGKKPQGKLSGSLYMNQATNELESYDKNTDSWKPVFKEKFQIIDGITNVFPSANPVKGELWIYNDVLCYWDGNSWKPIKAIAQDSSQFDLSLFENFLFLPELNAQGNTVVAGDDVEAYKAKYLLNKLDPETNAEFNGDDSKWKIGDVVNYKDNILPEAYIEGKAQYLLPNMSIDRVFINGRLNWDYEQVNSVTIQYPKNAVKNKSLSCIHVNPNKLAKITKHLFKIDRLNPRIEQSTANTEFYGFQVGNPYGVLLLPEKEPDDGGYFTDREQGIILSYDQCQNFDYVLSVTYEFVIAKSNGSLTHIDSREPKKSYYIQNFIGPNSLFIDGVEVGNDVFHEDNLTKTIFINENVNGREIEALHTIRREFGFVRQTTLKNRAVIETVQDYRRPLVFVNGEAMNTALGDVFAYNRDGLEIPEKVADRKLGRFEILNGKMNMTWTVVELCDRATDSSNDENDIHHDYDMYESEGIVPEADKDGNVYITYTTDDFSLTADANGNSVADHIVLFIDGLLINRKDIILDLKNKTISVPGLKPGQDYILLKDKYNYFANQDNVLPAVEVDRLSDSLVYMNGHLLCENRQFIASNVPTSTGLNGEVQIMPDTKMACYYNKTKEEWSAPTEELYNDVMSFANSYKNSTRAIQYNIPITVNDIIHVYAYRCANDYSNVISIENYYTPIIPVFVGNQDTQEASRELVIQGDYSDKKITVMINGIAASYENVEKITDETGIKTKITFVKPQFGMARVIVHPQRIPIRINAALPFECYEIYVNGVRQYGYVNTDAADDDWDGDAPEIAPNGRHFFEKDILALIRGDDRISRQEALNILSLEPKYHDALTDKSNINSAYTIETTSEGTYIKFNTPVCGMITYVIHPPENTGDNVGKQYFMDNRNLMPGTDNVYVLDDGESFFPGRSIVYVNGVRQSQDCYSQLNSKTLMFLDKDTQLIGNKNNYKTELIKNPDGSEYTEHVEYVLNKDNQIVRLPHKNSDRILIDVRNDYGWKEAHFKIKPAPSCSKIVLEDYGLDASLLETTDEIKIYIDGAFFGLKKDVGYRKIINIAHPVLEIIDADAIEMLTSDPLYNFYQSHPEEQIIYKNTHNSQEYVPPEKDIILEWR